MSKHYRWSWALLPLVVGIGFLIAACGGSTSAPTVDPPQLSAETAARYQFIAANQELAARLPCYCGCGETDGHASLRDCFLTERDAYNVHASGCAVCLGEAQDAEAFLADGLDLEAIRNRIVERWAAIGPPTPTA